MKFEKNFLLSKLEKLLKTDSPSGYTKNAIEVLKNEVDKLGYSLEQLNSGTGIVSIKGKSEEKTIAFISHVDTLGLMVRSITSTGHLKVTRIGSPVFPSLDSELCTIYTRDNKKYSGTIFSVTPSSHVYDNANTNARNEETLEVILDEIVTCKQDVLDLGINNGDIIAIDPKTVITNNDFIKSRFLDDKLSVIALIGALKYIKENNIIPKYNVKFIFSVFEEVGHGASYIPDDVTELIGVDMACVGKDLNCTEMDVAICPKDTSGPYNYEITTELIKLAKENDLKFAIDIYPYYNSDCSIAQRSKNDIRTALIGPGVFASHGYERSHYSALENTIKLILLYLM